MTDVPRQVLSEHFQDRLSGRRMLAAVFTAFQFDPGFFEKEILPVFFDSALSHVPAVRLVQLATLIREPETLIAVYYDANGLVQSDDGSAKLDIARVPVRLKTGIFHPKNIFLLVEDEQPDETGDRPQHLLVAALSANLTRTGWWENVEVCHIEELENRALTYLRDDLLEFFGTLRARAPARTTHQALDRIAKFVRTTVQLPQRSSAGVLHAQFYSGSRSFIEFLWDALGAGARDLNLEVISPYFDRDEKSSPLAELIRKFRPRKVRLYLPRAADGSAQCSRELYEWVANQAEVHWGRLAKELLRTGASEDARPRFVHAKVYRFFSTQPKREILIVGSVNLTQAAHQTGGNLESALLVEIKPDRRPEFWLEEDKQKPAFFAEPDRTDDGDVGIADSGSRLAIRFTWDAQRVDLYWDAEQPSSPLTVEANGVVQFTAEPLVPKTWIEAPAAAATALAKSLTISSFVTVVGDRPEPVPVLVQEEAMWKKPPLLSLLSVQDILRYWSLLSADQRNDFIQLRAAALLGDAAGNELVTRFRSEATIETIFSRFAGTFHAFECLERALTRSLEEDNEKDALYRLFNMHHDSLGSLLRRVREDAAQDGVDKYVIGLCAKQLCRGLRERWPALWSEHPVEAKELDAALAIVDETRAVLIAKNPEEMAPFLGWFDRWFLDRAKPLVDAP